MRTIISRSRQLEAISQDRLGKCYELSYQFASRNSDWNLVHGYIKDHRTGRIIDHAWVEKRNIVYDPVLDEEMPIQAYYALFQVEVEKVYSTEETRKQALAFEHYGPWHKIPKGKVKWWEI